MGVLGLSDGFADAAHQRGALQDLLGEAFVGGVVGREHLQSATSMGERDAGQQLQVVVDDVGVNRLGGDKDHAGLWQCQQDQEKEKALFIVGGAFKLGELFFVERHRGHDQHCLLHMSVGLEVVPELRKLRVQLLKAGLLFS